MVTCQNDFYIIDKLIAEQPCYWFLQYNPNVLITWKKLLLDYKVPYEALGLDESYLAFPTSAGNLCINDDCRLLLDDYLLMPKYYISKEELLALVPVIYEKTSFLPLPFITNDMTYTKIDDDFSFFYEKKLPT